MTLDPFDLLGLPAAFQVDPAALARAYLARSAAAHPDLSDDPAAAGDSAALNQARQALEDPEMRADVLLTRLGGPSREADRTLPEGFLAEMMAVREELEAAGAAGDSAAAARLEEWAGGQRAEHIARVGAMFQGLTGEPAQASLKAIRRELNAWRYIERMLEQIRLER